MQLFFKKSRLQLSVLLTAFLLTANLIHSQTIITKTFRPGPAEGIDAIVAKRFGCSIGTGDIGNGNFGVYPIVGMQQWTFNADGCSEGTLRSFIKFSQLSTIPNGAVIQSASLSFYGVPSSTTTPEGNSVYPGSPYSSFGSNVCWIERVTADWNENTITFNNQPPTSTVNRSAIPASTSQWNYDALNIDITALLKDIISSGNNYGFMLRQQTEQIYKNIIFAASDYTDSTRWPKLEVTYAMPSTPPPTINVNDITVNENAGVANVNVCLSSTTDRNVSFFLTTAAYTASSGSDYTSLHQQFTITAGQTCINVPIQIVDDNIVEPIENFTTNLSAITNAVAGDIQGLVYITDNDTINTIPSLSVSDLTISEATSPALVNVCLSAITNKDVSFFLTTAAYTASGSDYTSLHQQFTIPAGQTCISVPVIIINDNIVEPIEGFTTNLSSITNATADDIQGWVYITDNDSTNACPAGAICLINTCPATTVNLNNAYSINNLPAGTSVSWHTGTPATNANKLTAAQAAAIGASGNYYAAIYINGANCYSATILVAVNIQACTNASVVGNVIPAAMEISTKKISISPNPFANNIQASVHVQKDERVVLTVMDIFGREVKSKIVQLNTGKNQVSIDGLGKLPAGSYLLRVASGTTVETHKIIKQQ